MFQQGKDIMKPFADLEGENNEYKEEKDQEIG